MASRRPAYITLSEREYLPDYNWDDFLKGLGYSNARVVPADILPLFESVYERHLERTSRPTGHPSGQRQPTHVALRPENIRQLRGLINDPLRPEFPRIAEISQEHLHREQWRPSRRLVRLGRKHGIRSFEIPDYGLVETRESQIENGVVHEYVERVRWEDTLEGVADLGGEDDDDESIPEAEILDEFEKMGESDSETESDETRVKKAKGTDRGGSKSSAEFFVDKSPAPWRAQAGAFDSSD